jgi:hypothetical protein
MTCPSHLNGNPENQTAAVQNLGHFESVIQRSPRAICPSATIVSYALALTRPAASLRSSTLEILCMNNDNQGM